MLTCTSYQWHFHLHFMERRSWCNKFFIVGHGCSCTGMTAKPFVCSWHSQTVSQLQGSGDNPYFRVTQSVFISSLFWHPYFQSRHLCLELPGRHSLCFGTLTHTLEKYWEKTSLMIDFSLALVPVLHISPWKMMSEIWMWCERNKQPTLQGTLGNVGKGWIRDLDILRFFDFSSYCSSITYDHSFFFKVLFLF